MSVFDFRQSSILIPVYVEGAHHFEALRMEDEEMALRLEDAPSK